MSALAHIALIGCGFTGTSAFSQLVDGYPVKTITIFEASGEFGPGYPYRTEECGDYLINNTSDSMCLVPSNRRAFLNWLRNQPELAPDLDARGHLSRSVFGAFLKDAFAAAQTAAVIKGITVNLVPWEATKIQEDGHGRVRIGWAAGEILADAAILSTGRCPDVDAYPHPPEGSPARYIANHVMSSALDNLPLDAKVHILGASLSAYDVINRLFSPDSGCRFQRAAGAAGGRLCYEPGPNRRSVVLCSRSGRLKGMQSRQPMRLTRRRFTPAGLRAAAAPGGLRLADVARLIRQEAEDHGADIDWQRVLDPYRGCASGQEIDGRAKDLLSAAIEAASGEAGRNFLVDFFADAQVDIWDSFAERLLEAEDEAIYRDKIETAALCYAAPCPVPTAEKLLALHHAGRLTVVKGVSQVKLSDDGDAYHIQHEFGSDRARVLVNTTGAVERDVASAGQPQLIRNLVADGLLQGYQRGGRPMKGAAVDMKTFRAEGARNIYIASMLLWGPGFFTSSAFMMATIVERLLSSLFSAR